MKEAIAQNIGNPNQLEKLYRENKPAFKNAFNMIYPELQDLHAAKFWNERLNFKQQAIGRGISNELILVVVGSALAGLLAKIPDFTNIDHEFFYPRNLSFVVFPFLSAYFAWKQKIPVSRVIMLASIFLLAACYINFLPDNNNSDTLMLACIHMPLFAWVILGITFTGNKLQDYGRRIEYLRYNGDLLVITTIILIAGGMLTAVTLGLFELIDVPMQDIYFKYFVIWGLAAAPIVGTYLIQTIPELISHVSPVIARVFTPLVVVTLAVYLVAVVATGKDPYNDRDFLILFNLLLIGVMAIIFFSIAETSQSSASRFGTVLLFALAILTVIINCIALSAILFRISEWGITPNRIAVTGGNLLMLINLAIVTYQLLMALKNKSEIQKAENSIAAFLPVYAAWAVLVTFVFPVLFSFR